MIVALRAPARSAKPRRATEEGRRVPRTPLLIRALVFFCSAWFQEPGCRSKTPFSLCHCLVGCCLQSSPTMCVCIYIYIYIYML